MPARAGPPKACANFKQENSRLVRLAREAIGRYTPRADEFRTTNPIRHPREREAAPSWYGWFLVLDRRPVSGRIQRQRLEMAC